MTADIKDSEYTPWKKPPRKRWRKIFKAMALGLVLLLVGTGMFVMFLDKDTLRESLAKSLSEKTGMQVEIQFLDLGYSHGLGLEAGGLTVRTADGDRQLLWAESLFLEVEILPLLSGEIRVENAAIIKPRIKVYRDSKDPLKKEFKKASLSPLKNKTWNDPWIAKIITPEERPSAKPPARQKPTAPPVDRRIIREFRNRLKQLHITAENIHVEQGTLQFIDNTAEGLEESEPLKFSFDLKIRRPGPETIDVVLEGLHLDMGPLSLLGRMEVDDVLSESSRLEVQLRTKPFAIAELIRAFTSPPDNKPDTPEKNNFPVQIEQLTLLASCPLNSLTDGVAFSRDLKAETRFAARDAQLPVGGHELLISQVKGTAKWDEGYILYEVQGETLNGKIRIDGQQAFPLKTAENPDPLLNARVNLTALDFSRLISPKDWKPSSGLVSGVLKVAIPLSLAGPPLVTGSLVGENLVVASRQFTLSTRKTEVQFESSPNKPLSINVTSQGVVVDKIRFRQIKAHVSLPPGKVILVKSTWIPRHGTLAIHGSYNAKSQKYQLEFLGKDLWAGDYSKNQIQGIMRAHGSVNGYVPEKLPAIRGLFGTVSIKITPVNFDKAEEIKTILAVIDPTFFRRQNLNGLRFDYLGGNFKINNGKFNTSNLALKGGIMDVYLEGIFDGHTRSLNMLGKALPKFNMNKAFKSSPKLAKLLSTAQSQGGLVETHFKLEGPVARPQMTLIGIKPQKKTIQPLIKGLDNLFK